MKTITLSLKKHREVTHIFISFVYNQQIIQLLKSNTDALWSKSNKAWYLPFSYDSKKHLLEVLKDFKIIDKIHKQQLHLNQEQKQLVNSYYSFLRGKRYSESTIKTYTYFIAQFISFNHDIELNKLQNIHISRFIESVFLPKGYSINTQRQFISAIKQFTAFYPHTLIKNLELTRPTKSKKLPLVLSKQEVISIIRVTKNLKHRAIITLLYAAGLRISELLDLKLVDINIDRRQIRVVNGKGRKDRYVVLAENFIPLLLNYYNTYRPKNYFVENLNDKKYSASSVRKFIQRSCRAAQINKPVTPHTFRHSFATHLLENGVNLRHIQELLGHSRPETTMIYTHVSQKSLLNITSPLDQLMDKELKTDGLEQKFLLSRKLI